MNDPLPGFRWPIAVSQRIPAPAARVWSVISMPGNLELCHPFCASNPVGQWPGVGAEDAIHYYSGWVYQRKFLGWIEGIGYDLEIGREGGGRSLVSWRIHSRQAYTCELRIAIYPHALQNMPVLFRWLPHSMVLRPNLVQYLTSVLKGFEWYMTQGKPVKPNQFGSHPWFSTAEGARFAS